jgi:protein-S-isoprenylcysteine O-methyltransferase Ste14
MSAVRIAVALGWLVLGVIWLIAGVAAKPGSRGRRSWLSAVLVMAVVVLLRVLKPGGLVVRSPILVYPGGVVFAIGLALALWARLAIGRNWGMPKTLKDEPELVTSGPYRFVRHPIYTGFLLAMLGSALATSLYWLIVLVIIGGYFVHSARVEERLMTASFPDTYPGYRERTKMLIPFLL